MRPVAFASVLCLLATATSAATVVGTAHVVDGDTLRVGSLSIRLFGIDAPEAGQHCRDRDGQDWACGEAAAARLQTLVGIGAVSCEGDTLDDFGRLLAICIATDGTPINAVLVREGLAWAFIRYSTDFAPEQEAARPAGNGVWQAPNVPAWEYRDAQRAIVIATQPGAPSDCRVKGNINRDGERIFHMPGTPGYADTVIRVEDGERWFCTVDEALAAGWRAPGL